MTERLTPEQYEIFQTHMRMDFETLVRRIENERFMVKTFSYWLEKYSEFQRNSAILQKEINELVTKLEQCNARIQLMELCKNP